MLEMSADLCTNAFNIRAYVTLRFWECCKPNMTHCSLCAIHLQLRQDPGLTLYGTERDELEVFKITLEVTILDKYWFKSTGSVASQLSAESEHSRSDDQLGGSPTTCIYGASLE